uniref:Uncharacterized protein n=1 Tax=Ditylenchus dipsaci TaxID=166011 RepID=A0A915ERV2_9BILA
MFKLTVIALFSSQLSKMSTDHKQVMEVSLSKNSKEAVICGELKLHGLNQLFTLKLSQESIDSPLQAQLVDQQVSTESQTPAQNHTTISNQITISQKPSIVLPVFNHLSLLCCCFQRGCSLHFLVGLTLFCSLHISLHIQYWEIGILAAYQTLHKREQNGIKSDVFHQKLDNLKEKMMKTTFLTHSLEVVNDSIYAARFVDLVKQEGKDER